VEGQGRLQRQRSLVSRVAIATSSHLAAEAGRRIADEGGNAVDAAVAAALVAGVTEPPVCSLGGGAFITVWPPAAEPVTIDGYVEMPGRGLPPERFGRGGIAVEMEYGGGVRTIVGPGSVATPGTLAAADLAWRRYGCLPWRALVMPACEHAAAGFPLSQPSHDYLVYSGDSIFGWDPPSRAAFHDGEGRLLAQGERAHVPGLRETLSAIAEEGAEVFYRGEVGQRIVADLAAGGGILTAADMEAYRPEVREPLHVATDGWEVVTNPPPAVGGATLAALLLLMEGHPAGGWTPDELLRLVRAQERVFRFRMARLETSCDREGEVCELLSLAGGEWRRGLVSPSTVQVSAVDSEGLACSISLSSGYGSGAVPGGTGLWMNNCLGELELNRQGFHACAPGTRLPSNMAPTIARREDGTVLAIGSPGASRITSAILMTLINHLHLKMPLEEAILHPRLHVALTDDGFRVDYEEGLAVDRLDVPQQRMERHMYFGGVAAVLFEHGRGFTAAADPRRTGATAIGGV
jgi:gamma-glutamyltranspeptidase / glutathione hydrolase